MAHASECLQIHPSAVYTAACLNRFLNVLLGRIDASEIRQSLAELGIDISRENALKILQRFDLHFYPLFTTSPLNLAIWLYLA